MKLVIHERVTLEGLTHLPGEVEVDFERAQKLLTTFKGGELEVYSIVKADVVPAPEPEPEAPVAEADPAGATEPVATAAEVPQATAVAPESAPEESGSGNVGRSKRSKR